MFFKYEMRYSKISILGFVLTIFCCIFIFASLFSIFLFSIISRGHTLSVLMIVVLILNILGIFLSKIKKLKGFWLSVIGLVITVFIFIWLPGRFAF